MSRETECIARNARSPLPSPPKVRHRLCQRRALDKAATPGQQPSVCPRHITLRLLLAENGVSAFRNGSPVPGPSFVEHVGETRYKEMVNWVLRYIADLDIPTKRGTFVELRNGNVNISPIGQGVCQSEMEDFWCYDRVHGVRKDMIQAMQRQFADLDLRYAIGGRSCFDVFPVGWDKTYCLRHVEAERERSGVVFDVVHFFGDKTSEGGNDRELYEDPRTVGHKVLGPEDTARQVRELFDL